MFSWVTRATLCVVSLSNLKVWLLPREWLTMDTLPVSDGRTTFERLFEDKLRYTLRYLCLRLTRLMASTQISIFISAKPYLKNWSIVILGRYMKMFVKMYHTRVKNFKSFKWTVSGSISCEKRWSRTVGDAANKA